MAAREFNTILSERKKAFDLLEKGSLEQAELDRNQINDLKAEILRLQGVENELKADLGRVDRALRGMCPPCFLCVADVRLPVLTVLSGCSLLSGGGRAGEAERPCRPRRAGDPGGDGRLRDVHRRPGSAVRVGD